MQTFLVVWQYGDPNRAIEPQENVASRELPSLTTARLYHACAAYEVHGAQVVQVVHKVLAF